MGANASAWLINNETSGSNDEEALAGCRSALEDHGIAVVGHTVFPATDLPTHRMLDDAGADTVAVFAGDGTINAVLESLAGWSGAALVLPGGTMNLLYHRLFGDLSIEDAAAAVADGRATRQRPAIIASGCGKAYAGLLAGPGTAWADVRESMRDFAVLDIAANTREALAETLYGTRLRCREPDLGSDEGYPLILLTPRAGKIEIDAYHADEASEYIEQTLALMRRQFREGPQDRLGEIAAVSLADVQGGTFGVLLDGEECQADSPTKFTLSPSEVDLLATVADA